MRVEGLSRNEVHVWTIERDRRADLALLAQCLSPTEQQRARRLRLKDRREAFIYNRALVRRILAGYVGIEPSDVPLTTSSAGKPLWDAPIGNAAHSPGLSFNLSHRHDLAILAVAQGRTLGVDLEAFDAQTNYDAIARAALSPREMLLYQQIESADRPAALLRMWTRKEAFLKATGLGLGRPLSQIEVTFSISEPPQLLASGDHRETPGDWLLESWSPRPDWFAALATPREGGSLHLRFHSATSLRDWHTSLYNLEAAS
jgi:4'-phosphopantetheinyl transferase